ncbi:MAG: ornithine cyclodeaminase family protein [Acidobacteriia bacterium]|nr:ornithine cyclodeaminase family protein [Terriglobia bacterium]
MEYAGAGHDRILYLARADVQAICEELDPLAIVEEVFRLYVRGEAILPGEAYLAWRNNRGEAVRSLNMPGYLGGSNRTAGTKIINSNPANPSRGLVRGSGVTLLFDPETTRIQCIMEGAYISALRTAAVSMLALKLLAHGSVHSLCLIGTGVIGRAHLELARRTFPALERVVLFDLNPASAEEAANYLRHKPGHPLQIEVAASAMSAVRATHVVIAATTVTSGYIPYDWLRPGTVAINVSLDDFLPDVFLKASLLFVDNWNLVQADSHRLLGRLHREGKIAAPEQMPPQHGRKVDGEIADLLLGRHPGRRSTEDMILVNPFGLSLEDLGFAARIFEAARQKGRGQYLDV